MPSSRVLNISMLDSDRFEDRLAVTRDPDRASRTARIGRRPKRFTEADRQLPDNGHAEADVHPVYVRAGSLAGAAGEEQLGDEQRG